MKPGPQIIPLRGPAREALRAKGQFWTPDWVAEAMVGYVVGAGGDTIFDPAVGAGAFFRAARSIGRETGRKFELSGYEIDPQAIQEAKKKTGRLIMIWLGLKSGIFSFSLPLLPCRRDWRVLPIGGLLKKRINCV